MDFSRYQRQMLLGAIGPTGQARLSEAKALLVGVGALGSALAEQLARAGVGSLRIVDRDFVEMTNLQRQTLFEESDARDGLPKAVAAANRLARINSSVHIQAIATDVHAGNIEDLAADMHLILDGSDNAETRYLINDVAVKRALPWVYGGCVGVEGRVMAIHSPATPCLRCIFPTPPAPGELPTCDTAGVLGPAAGVVACLQAVAAMKLILGEPPQPQLLHMDLWSGRFHSASTADAKRPDCIACGQRRFEFLDRRDAADAVSLCGRNAIQVRPVGGATSLDFSVLAARLGRIARVQRTPHLLRWYLAEKGAMVFSLFTDGRLIIQGTTDPALARSLYARFVGT